LVKKEEQINYERYIKETWVGDLKDILLGIHDANNISKPILTGAPSLCPHFLDLGHIGLGRWTWLKAVLPFQSLKDSPCLVQVVPGIGVPDCPRLKAGL
jgi:hypothetical protein